MKRVFSTIALLTGVVMTTSINAAEVLKLTVNEAVEIALSENPTIKIAELEVERYDYVRKTTLGSLLPQLSVDGTYDQTLKSQAFARGFSLGGNQYATLTANGNISIALFAPTVYQTLKMNATEAEAAVESARSSRIDLVAAVKDSFYGVLLAERSLEVLEESSTTSKQIVDDTQVKFDNGLAAEYDLITAQVQYSNLQPTIMQTRTSIKIAKDVLKMYLSIPQDVEIEVVGDLDEMRNTALSLSHNLPHDISENSSLKSLALNQDLLAHQLKINNASRMPTIGAFGLLTLTGNNMNGVDEYFQSVESNSFFWQNPMYVGVSVNIPIFTGLSTTNRSKQIRNQIKQLKLQQNYLEQSVNVSLSTAISNINTARETLFAQQQTVEQANKAYYISTARYNAGTGTILELNSAQLSLTQAELNFSQAIYDLLTAKSEYDRIVGAE
ncbi:MAG: TolC family protein [Rikenellaceae bacterium]